MLRMCGNCINYSDKPCLLAEKSICNGFSSFKITDEAWDKYNNTPLKHNGKPKSGIKADDKLEKALDIACEKLGESVDCSKTGGSPKCETDCDTNYKKCWKEYLLREAGK